MTAKTMATAAAAVVAVTMASTIPARSADLGGDSCADLESRVAAIEAEAVRKGNRKVSLTISGVVDYSLLESNVAIGTASHHTRDIVANPNDDTLIRMIGEGKINKDVSAGFVIEMNPRPNLIADAEQTYVFLRAGDM